MRKYLGLIALSLNLLSFFACRLLITEPEFYGSNFVLSDFGADSRTALIFNLTLILSGVLFLLFLKYLVEDYKIKYTSPALISFVISITCLILIGIFPYTTIYAVHWLSAFEYFLFFAIGSILFGFQILSKKRLEAMRSIIIGFMMIIGFIFFWNYSSPHAIAELWSVVMGLVWVVSIMI